MGAPQTFKTPSGDEMVILTKVDYEALIEAAADAEEDAAVYAERKTALASGKDEVLPTDLSALIHNGNSMLRAVRKWRKMNQVVLAEALGITQSYLSLIENGERPFTMDMAAKASKLMDVPYRWFKP